MQMLSKGLPSLAVSSSLCRVFSVHASAITIGSGSSRTCGIVGLPNVGKSTLFNALTNTQLAEASNYPFCTIKPNVGRVAVPDKRLLRLAEMANSKQTISTQLEFVDIAGLIKGASKGQGLGNQFLANIRQVSVLLHVVRCYEDTNITHVEGNVDPVRDADIVNTELLLADLETLQRRITTIGRKSDPASEVAKRLYDKIAQELNNGRPARNMTIEDDEVPAFKELQLLTAKPVVYVCNTNDAECVKGNKYCEQVATFAASEQASSLIVSAKLEEEVSQLEEASRTEFLSMYGLEETGLAKIVCAAWEMLKLRVFYTVGPQETRAWLLLCGADVVQAAGQIHSDIAKGFISAETVSYDDWIACGGTEQAAKQQGKLRIEGRHYIPADGDVMHFRFNN